MITFTIDFPTDILETQFIQILSQQYGYTEMIPDPQGGDPIPNPQTRLEFISTGIPREIVDIVKNRMKRDGSMDTETQVDALFADVHVR